MLVLQQVDELERHSMSLAGQVLCEESALTLTHWKSVSIAHRMRRGARNETDC